MTDIIGLVNLRLVTQSLWQLNFAIQNVVCYEFTVYLWIFTVLFNHFMILFSFKDQFWIEYLHNIQNLVQ